LSVGGIVGIIIAIIVVICAFSWWKRKKLAEMASKISSATVKKSVWIRKSLKRMSTRFDWSTNNQDAQDEE
jgi:NADH:ubiquinone oxidoreductase subunit H